MSYTAAVVPYLNDNQRKALTDDLQAWNDASARGGYPGLPHRVDDVTLQAVKRAIDACLKAKDERGNPRPFHLPIWIAYLAVEAALLKPDK